MMEIEDDTKEPGTIIQEIQKGFTIKDRLLRPSLVGVSKKVTKNYGHQNALYAAFNETVNLFDIVITIDADLQDDPEYY